MNSLVPIRPDGEPPKAPLAFPPQDLSAPFHDPAAPGATRLRHRWIWRAAVFLPAIAATATIVALFTNFFAMGGLSPFEIVLISLVAFTFFWIAMSVAMACAGVVSVNLPQDRTPSPDPIDVAIVVPIHNEVPSAVFGNAAAMLEGLSKEGGGHRYAFFILSDTRSEDVVEEELRALDTLRLVAPADIPIYYRRFPENPEKKIGNLAEWVRRCGGAYEGMLVLDADSLMSAAAMRRLVDALAADPGAGLIQSTPAIIQSDTISGRIQQFATAAHGPLLSAGLAAWTGREGNYWGHNAIIRTRAFAACAGLPRLGRAGRLIMSHDFVEAALLRRAGWSVSMLPAAPGSYEEAPATLIDYVRRDARWCRGNLQHLRLLATKGLHPISRFHLFQGAMSYLVSPVWLVLLLIWAAIGVGEDKSLIVYFSGNDPRPNWPELTGARQVALLLLMYGMLLAPKLIGAVRVMLSRGRVQAFGGRARFVHSAATEITLSVLYAPILMVQQTLAVLGSAIGIDTAWKSYRCGGQGQSTWLLMRFHAAETLIGTALTFGIILGFVTPWLLPIAGSLALSVPLSRLSGVRLDRCPGLMATPEDRDPPAVLRSARLHRADLERVASAPLPIAAE